MIRWTVAGLIVVGLLVGIWMLWPGDETPTPTTTPEAVGTMTTETATTTTSATTTTTVDPLQVREVETVEQAEAILRELWFGWFEGIYNQDEDRIREVVATEEQVEEGRQAFSSEFLREPMASDISFRSTEILRSDDGCLALWADITVQGFREGESQDVHVLRWFDGHWAMLGLWEHRHDFWETDCDVVLQS